MYCLNVGTICYLPIIAKVLIYTSVLNHPSELCQCPFFIAFYNSDDSFLSTLVVPTPTFVFTGGILRAFLIAELII